DSQVMPDDRLADLCLRDRQKLVDALPADRVGRNHALPAALNRIRWVSTIEAQLRRRRVNPLLTARPDRPTRLGGRPSSIFSRFSRPGTMIRRLGAADAPAAAAA